MVLLMDIELWMDNAKEIINQKVKIGQRFELRSLFETVEWETLRKGERIQFGKDFANAVSEGRFPNIERVERGANNHAQYIKVESL